MKTLSLIQNKTQKVIFTAVSEEEAERKLDQAIKQLVLETEDFDVYTMFVVKFADVQNISDVNVFQYDETFDRADPESIDWYEQMGIGDWASTKEVEDALDAKFVLS